MLIAKIKNNKIIETNNVILKDGKLLEFMIKDEWAIVQDEQPESKKYHNIIRTGVEIINGVPIAKYTYKPSVNIDELKQQMVTQFKQESQTKRNKLIPDHRIVNLLLGIGGYDYNISDVKVTVNAFRDEYYKLESKIKAATTYDDLEIIESLYPTTVLKGPIV